MEISRKQSMKQSIRSFWSLPLLGLGLSFIQSGVWAQESYILDEVTVSARKKEEKAIQVPLSVTKYTEQKMVDSRLESVRDVVQSTPNVQITGSGSGRSITPYIRGKGNQDIQLPEEQSVGVYVDEVPLPRYAFDLDMLDIREVEVLRGPQGTLFGKNTQAGAIHILSNQPLDEGARSSVQVGAGNLDSREARLKLNNTFWDKKLGSGLSLSYKKQDGWLEDDLQGRKWGDREKFSLKEVLQFKWGEDLQAVFNLRYDQEKGTDPILVERGLRPPKTHQSIRPDYQDDLSLFSLKLTKELERFKLVSISSFNYHNFDFKYDESDGYIARRIIPAGMIDDPNKLFRDFNEYERQYFQEFRVHNKDAETSWLVGANFSFLNYNLQSFIDTLVVTQAGTLAPAQIDQDIKIKSAGEAVFGHLDQQLARDWTLSLGARYSFDQKEYQAHHQGRSSVAGAVLGQYQQKSQENFQDANGQVGLSYRVNPQVNVYTLVSRGYQAGGFPAYQFNNYAGIAQDQAPYAKSVVHSSEVGVKTQWWEGRMQISGALFYDDIDNKQIRVRDRQTNFSQYANLDSAAYGGELEFFLSPIQALELGVNAGYTQAEFKENLQSSSGNIRKGAKVANVPQWNGSSFVQYRYFWNPLQSILFGKVDYQYTGRRFGENDNLTTLDAYGVWNLNLGWEKENLEFHFFVKNLFDKYYETQGYYYSTFQTTVATPAPPRRYGASLRYFF